MGASSIASGRKPSMLRMITRVMAGCGVCVTVGIAVNVNVGAEVCVRVEAGVADGAVVGLDI